MAASLSPVPTEGDNAALLTSTVPLDGQMGAIALGAMVAAANGAYLIKTAGISIPLPGHTIYGLLEANAAYAPGAEEEFTAFLFYEV